MQGEFFSRLGGERGCDELAAGNSAVRGQRWCLCNDLVNALNCALTIQNRLHTSSLQLSRQHRNVREAALGKVATNVHTSSHTAQLLRKLTIRVVNYRQTTATRQRRDLTQDLTRATAGELRLCTRFLLTFQIRLLQFKKFSLQLTTERPARKVERVRRTAHVRARL